MWGRAFSVAVIDSGIDPGHLDLFANLDPSRHWNFDTSTREIRDIGDGGRGHGTLVAGIIAARDNQIGARGVAPRARIHAYNPIQAVISDRQVAHAFAEDVARTAVANNSWGANEEPLAAAASAIVNRALEEGLRVGNAGKGTLYTFAAGNGAENGDETNLDELLTHHGVTVVGAVDDRGLRTVFSAPGSNLWLTAPVQHHDLRSPDYYLPVSTAAGGGYLFFNGTSRHDAHGQRRRGAAARGLSRSDVAGRQADPSRVPRARRMPPTPAGGRAP